MKKLYKDLWQTKRYIVFGRVHTHGYFLQCEQGNVLIYNTGHHDEINHIAELGGITYQYLSHRDETGDTLKSIKEKFSSKLCCHIQEKSSIAKLCSVDVAFTENITHFSGIEIIHTPGHTDGSISLYYHSPHGRTYLFTGDTLIQTNGSWETVLFPDTGNAQLLENSLNLYKTLEPDVVIWSASGGGEPTFATPKKTEWIGILDNEISKLHK